VSGLESTDTGETSVDLIWNANTESDLAGYNIYRDGTLVNGALITTTRFQDTGLKKKTTYSYTATAVDIEGHESLPQDQALDVKTK